MSLFPLIYPLPSYAKTERLPEPNTELTARPPVAMASSSPITVEAIWPVKPNNEMKSLKGGGNCVKCMRAAGFTVPMGYVRGAKWIPAPLPDIAEGEVAVAVTYEGWVGHVVLVQKVHEKLVVVFECNYASRHPGDEVPSEVVKGFLPQDDAAIAKLIKAKEPLVKPVAQPVSKLSAA